jgi:hypothetical protein
MTFLEMQTRVGELINQSVTDDSSLVTLTEVKANLNRAYQKVYNRVTSLGQGYGLRESYTDLVAGQSRYGFPDDFKKLDRVEIGYDTAETRVLAKAITRDAINSPQTSFSQANPVYAMLGNMFQIFPTPLGTSPDDDVTDGIHLWYIEDVVDLEDDADEAVLPIGYDDLCIEYAVAQAKRRQGLVDEARESLGEFYNELERMVDEVVERVDEGSEVIVRDVY